MILLLQTQSFPCLSLSQGQRQVTAIARRLVQGCVSHSVQRPVQDVRVVRVVPVVMDHVTDLVLEDAVGRALLFVKRLVQADVLAPVPVVLVLAMVVLVVVLADVMVVVMVVAVLVVLYAQAVQGALQAAAEVAPANIVEIRRCKK